LFQKHWNRYNEYKNEFVRDLSSHFHKNFEAKRKMPLKEEPNTKNVLTWPESFTVGEDRHARQRKGKVKDSIGLRYSPDDRTEDSEQPLDHREPYLFGIIIAIVWCPLVYLILKWLQFPFFLHRLAVLLMMALPILILWLFIYAMISIDR
jgi:hypothetical protein